MSETVGDIAYADAWLKEVAGGYLPMTDIPGGVQVYDRILNDFYNQVEVLSSLKPYMVGPGNHGTRSLQFTKHNMG
jgi:hypothetical protein